MRFFTPRMLMMMRQNLTFFLSKCQNAPFSHDKFFNFDHIGKQIFPKEHSLRFLNFENSKHMESMTSFYDHLQKEVRLFSEMTHGWSIIKSISCDTRWMMAVQMWSNNELIVGHWCENLAHWSFATLKGSMIFSSFYFRWWCLSHVLFAHLPHLLLDAWPDISNKHQCW